MPYHEFVEWVAYKNIRQNRLEKIDLYLAQICLTIAQVNGNKKSRLKDFLFDFNEKENKGLDLKARMMAWAKRTNKQMEKGKDNGTRNPVSKTDRKHKRSKVFPRKSVC